MIKKFYGCTHLDVKDELKIRTIELEYYKLWKNNKYGVEILKREFCEDIIKVEKQNINCTIEDEKVINKLLEKLKNNKVLPCTLKDIVTDMKI